MISLIPIPNAYAACTLKDGFKNCLGDINSPTGSKFSETGLIGDILTRILPIVIAVGGMLTVIFIIISGIQFITSSGDPKGAEAARARLIYAIVGFIVLILAFAALQIIDKIFLKSQIAG